MFLLPACKNNNPKDPEFPTFLYHNCISLHMNRYRFYLLILFILIIHNSCTRNDENPDIPKSLVINELMAINTITAFDQDGEYDDWIELYNLSSNEIDLTGYYLTDSKNNLTKWKFPPGTSIVGKGYLIIWADKDTTQTGLHTNYKLSSLGEKVLLLTPGLEIIDKVEYGSQTYELAYARVPNGTGAFIWHGATFNNSND
jgi:hypothetical protein